MRNLSYRIKRLAVKARGVFRQIALFLMGTILQGVLGSLANWGIAPLLIEYLNFWEALPIIYIINLARLWISIYSYDLASGGLKPGKVDVQTEKRKITFARVLKVVVEFTFVVLFAMLNNFFAIMHARQNAVGIPVRIYPKVFLGILASTVASMLGAQEILIPAYKLILKILYFRINYPFPWIV